MEPSLLDNAENLWAAVSERLREALSEATFQTWFGAAAGSELTDDFFVVSVPNEFTREWIEGHFLDLLRATVRDLVGRECGVYSRWWIRWKRWSPSLRHLSPREMSQSEARSVRRPRA